MMDDTQYMDRKMRYHDLDEDSDDDVNDDDD